MHLTLNLKVLNEIRQDLARIENQLPVRFRNPEVQEKMREELKELQAAAAKLYTHYKTVLDSQV